MALVTTMLTGIGVGSSVSGPDSSTDNAVARWNGTTGNTLQDSSVLISDADAVSGVTQLDVDNIRIDGNTISVTDTDGDLILNSNGTGNILCNDSGLIAGDPGLEGSGITVNGITYDAALKVSDLGGSKVAQFILHRHSTTLAPVIVSARSHSNDSTHAIVQDGDKLMSLISTGWDGSDYAIATRIDCEIDGTPGANDMPGRIVFKTTSDSAQAATERMRISSDGSVNIAGLTASRPVSTDASKNLISSDYNIYAEITLSNANVTGMYAAPVELVAAPGAGSAIVVHRVFVQHEYDTAAFTGGGAVVIQYSNTANGAGTQAADTLSDSIFTTGAQTGQMQNGQLPVSATTIYDNVGIYISNQTAAFATGSGTALVRIWYSIISV